MSIIIWKNLSITNETLTRLYKFHQSTMIIVYIYIYSYKRISPYFVCTSIWCSWIDLTSEFIYFTETWKMWKIMFIVTFQLSYIFFFHQTSQLLLHMRKAHVVYLTTLEVVISKLYSESFELISSCNLFSSLIFHLLIGSQSAAT